MYNGFFFLFALANFTCYRLMTEKISYFISRPYCEGYLDIDNLNLEVCRVKPSANLSNRFEY